MRQFRLLNADEIECRISEIDKEGRVLRLLLYKTARTDAALLDETCGYMGWCNDYREINGKMYCGIAIRDKDSGEWIWKWNVGTESNAEAEKGQASDALKRAGFVWGVGTELYSAPTIKIFSDRCNIKQYGGKWRCYDNFSVAEISYNDREEISGLSIRCNRDICFTYGDVKDKLPSAKTQSQSRQKPSGNSPSQSQPSGAPAPKPGYRRPPESDVPVLCSKCGAQFMDYFDGTSLLKAASLAERSKSKNGVVLCAKCTKEKAGEAS